MTIDRNVTCDSVAYCQYVHIYDVYNPEISRDTTFAISYITHNEGVN